MFRKLINFYFKAYNPEDRQGSQSDLEVSALCSDSRFITEVCPSTTIHYLQRAYFVSSVYV